MSELFKEFQEFRKILCICPCCGELHRVSDLKLKAKGPSVDTWLDQHEKKVQLFEKKEERFQDKESELRKKAVEKGRIDAEKTTRKAISPELRALRLVPQDVIPILHPVDFVVFKGMTKQTISNIMFLSSKCKSPTLNTARRQIEKAINKKKYNFQVARIDEKGNIGFE